jgi:parallel beta-helix repeat protein
MFCIQNVSYLVEAADTIIVDDDGTGDYTDIQTAINNAGVGDYIVVKDGTYAEQLTVNVNALTIVAASGETPTLYLSSYSVGIDVTATDVLIEGFEIYGNGSLTGGPSPTIRANTGAHGLTVHDNSFKVLTGEIGQIALYINSGVTNVLFTSNTLTNYEHSVYHAAWISGQQAYYGSIQDVIDIADAGETVIVADGIYTEQITVNKSITLTSTTGDYISSEAVIDLGSLATYAIEFEQGCDGATVKGLEIIDSYGIYVNLNAGGEGNVTIQDNYIHDLFVSGAITGGFVVDASCWPPLENWTIQDNILENITGSLSSGLRPENMKNVVITGNTIRNMGYSGILLINVDGGVVSNNIVSNIGRAGIQVDNYCTRVITITYNVVTQANTGSHSGYGGIRFYGQYIPDPHGRPPAEITVMRNTCNDSYNGLAVRNGENISTRNITARYNSFTNNSNMGVYHGGSGILDAASNWWGNMWGPYHPTENPSGIGDTVSDTVTFYPWLEFDGYSTPPEVTYEVGIPQANYGLIISDTTRIGITAYDNETGIDTLTYRTWDTVNRWGPWKNYTDKFTLHEEGKHMVQYNATDNVGTNNTDINTHYVDTTKPSINLQYPNGGEFISGILTIQWDAADKISDQFNADWFESQSLTEDYPGHIQSFNPTNNKLTSVQLLLYGDDANISVRIYSDITPIPVPVGHSSQRLQDIGNPANPVWIDFPLEYELTVDTDATYYLGVTQEIYGTTGFDWYYLNTSIGYDPYPHGHAWLKKTDMLESHPDWDWTFKTMYWEDCRIDVEYSVTGTSPWSTLAEGQINDGSYIWDTSIYPDGGSYKVRVIAIDEILNMEADASDGTFTIDNTGPSITNIIITDTTIGNTSYTKDEDNLIIKATITGNPVTIEADLTGFGGSSVTPPTSFTGSTATWTINSITCTPTDGPITVTITAIDATGDTSGNIGSIIADNTPPIVDFTRPLPGLYFMDSMRLLPFSYPFVIGQITMGADAYDDTGSGIKKVEFYVEDDLKGTVTEVPYNYRWDEAAVGFFKFKIIAYDNVEHSTTEEMKDIFMLNFDIWGQ